MWLALASAVVAVVVAVTIGVIAGYRTAAHQANANYGARLDAAQSTIASFRAAEAAKVPDLKAVAARYFRPGTEV